MVQRKVQRSFKEIIYGTKNSLAFFIGEFHLRDEIIWNTGSHNK